MIKATTTVYSYGDPKAAALEGTALGIKENLLKMEAQQKALCPVAQDRGGFLRDSIGNRLTIRRVVVGEVGTGVLYPVDYGIYQELGTIKMAAQPHVRPGAEIVQNSGESKNIMIKYGREQMERELQDRKDKKVLNG